VYNITTYDNDLRVVTERIDLFKSVSVGIWVNVGSRDESLSEAGISHLIEHMIFKGTARRTAWDIAKEIDQVGGIINAFTGKEFTCFYAKVMGDHLPLVADLLTDIFLSSNFDPLELERERQVILQEIRMLEDTPDELVHSLFAENLWPGQSVGRPIMGTAASVAGFDRDRVHGYLKRHYQPHKMVVAAAGLLDHQELVDLLGPAFAALTAGDGAVHDRPPVPSPGLRVSARDLEQAHFCLGGPFPSMLDQRRFAATVLNIILGGNMSSRLFQEIREKRGLAYSVYSFYTPFLNSGMIGVYAGVEPGRLVETAALVLEQIAQLRGGRVGPAELRSAKEHLKGSIALSSESVDNRMIRLAKNELTYRRHIDFEEIIDAVERVTVDDVVALAEDYLKPKDLNLTVLGPLSGTDIPADLLS
jgi:predicted Zn-dependent peptidase